MAIVGYSCILPGGENVTEAWNTIQSGLDCVRDLPNDRVDVTAYYSGSVDHNPVDKIYCTRGGFIPDFEFDPRECATSAPPTPPPTPPLTPPPPPMPPPSPMPPVLHRYNFNMLQMEDTDTNQTLSLLKVKEALEDAGLNPSGTVKKNIGCVLGIGGGQKSSNEFYSRMNYVVVEKVLRKMGLPETDVTAAVTKFKSHFPEWRLDSFPGFLGNVTAGRCTNVFNLDGMNCVVDAACASSLIAVKVAIDELLRGDCETMIAGATCSDCSLAMYMAFSKTPVFSTKQGLSAYDKESKVTLTPTLTLTSNPNL